MLSCISLFIYVYTSGRSNSHPCHGLRLLCSLPIPCACHRAIGWGSFTKLSVSVFSGATVLKSVFGWNRELSAVGLVVLTAVYTAMGGLAAVIVTDVAQSVVLLLGAACMTAVGFARAGGYEALQLAPPSNLTAGEWARFFHLYRPPGDPDYPTLGLALGTNVGGLW